MAVLVKNIADHFGPWVKEHMVAEGRRPVRYSKARAFTGDEAADKKQRKSGASESYGESMGPNTRVPPTLRGPDANKPGLALMGASRGSGTELLVLRQPILLHFRRAVFIGPAVHHGLDLEVPMWRWGSCNPLQSIRLPGIALGFLAGEKTPKEIDQEENLRSAENQSAHRNKDIPMLHRLDKLLLHRVINPPHMTANTQKVHREKGAVE